MIPSTRYLLSHIKDDLSDRMVFVGGPRQVGKTTLALQTLTPKNAKESHPAYLNWDSLADRKKLLNNHLPSKQSTIIFDEIHKFGEWRNLVKGYYDKHKSKISFLVTGSARLDYYRRGGDSLQGRYHYYRLFPFSLPEISKSPTPENLEQLLNFGGFPEPLLKADTRFHRRWLREYTSRVVYDDLRALESVRDVSKIELLLEHLPDCVASPLSIRSFSQLLSVSHESIEKWISILERLYIVFRIPPYGHKNIRAVKKENKLYFWDWSRIEEAGQRFENLVACQLLKYCCFIEDTEGFRMQLQFIRDTDKREIDFVVLKDGKPEFAVECKLSDSKTSSKHGYFRERTDIPKFYLVHTGQTDHGNAETDQRVLPFIRFCEELEMP
ncbi:MAG: ATP-binding protein [Verrucomicrobiota bacterium]